jgi:hypothetical protein
MRTICLAACILLATSVAVPVAADEIVDQINGAIDLYRAGDFVGAASELEFAAAQIRQLRAGEVSGALPAPLSGWTARDVETAAMGAAMLGGGTSASRVYERDRARVEVKIMTDSPMLQAVTMMLNNPMVLSGSGQKLIRVKGNQAALDWKEDRGTLNVVVMNSLLVTVEGRRCAEQDLIAYAEAVDYDLLKQILAR